MSGSSLDGLDLAYVHFQETGGKWDYQIIHADCIPYDKDWVNQLKNAVSLSALDYQLLHTDFGNFMGQQINLFIDQHQLQHQVDLIASHGHTSFHLPARKMTAQLGDGAAIAAITGLPVVSDLRAMDIAFGGQGAPIVPIGEKLLFGNYRYFLNLGGIANISINQNNGYTAFDVCAANRVLNMLVQPTGVNFDNNGIIASGGMVQQDLLTALNELAYYQLPYPKSLANNFGTDIVYPLIQTHQLQVQDSLRTYTEHIAIQVQKAVQSVPLPDIASAATLLVTGGGAHNGFLVERIKERLMEQQIELVVPSAELVDFKEAVVMALIGVLRWREEYNVLSSVTGAKRNSINGALWLGGEA